MMLMIREAMIEEMEERELKEEKERILSCNEVKIFLLCLLHHVYNGVI